MKQFFQGLIASICVLLFYASEVVIDLNPQAHASDLGNKADDLQIANEPQVSRSAVQEQQFARSESTADGAEPSHMRKATDSDPKPASASVCNADKHATPEILYQPDLPDWKSFSYPSAIITVHEGTPEQVILGDCEPLKSAEKRIVGNAGVIYIPWKSRVLQCDSLYQSKESISIVAERGPNRELKRFYCRRENMGGEVPGRVGKFVTMSKKAKGLHIESLHVDGYGTWVQMHRNSEKLIIRGNYMHSSSGYGISTSNIPIDDAGKHQKIDLVGNHLTNTGNHVTYLHRSLNPDSSVTVNVVGNVVHSSNGMSGIKTIANRNYIAHNDFAKSRVTPGLPRLYINMLLDVAAAADNTIVFNGFDMNTSPDTPASGPASIGIRNRKSIYGGGYPYPYYPSGTLTDVNGNKVYCEREPFNPTCALPDSKFWNEDFWKDAPVYQTEIAHNTFTTSGYSGQKKKAIESQGTYPNYTLKLGGLPCLIPVPEFWHERLDLQIHDNKYSGYSPKHAYEITVVAPDIGVGDMDPCGVVFKGPDFRTDNFATIENETFH